MAELEHRLGAAWRRFWTLKQELTCKSYSLNIRLKLFNAVVSSTLLYGCEAWTLTQKMELQLRRGQRRMLRIILGSGRRRQMDGPGGEDLLEPWVDWIQRTTHDIEARMSRLRCPNWVEIQHDRKRRWAERLMTTDTQTWAFRLLQWEPDPYKFGRACGRPRRRWSDSLQF